MSLLRELAFEKSRTRRKERRTTRSYESRDRPLVELVY